MEPFRKVTSVATPLPMENIDTDVIVPGKYLKTIKRSGLGAIAFESLRFEDDGNATPRSDSVFNQPTYQGAEILVTGPNFGCGSSREHAAWGIADMGFKAIIGTSFADIFDSNCFKNGIATIVLKPDQWQKVLRDAEAGKPITVDLEENQVVLADGETLSFAMNEFRRKCLLEGLDEVALTLQSEDAIAAFEERQRQAQPWLHNAF